MIQVTCPQCKAEYGVSDDSRGRKYKCRKCGAVVDVPLVNGPAEAGRKPSPRTVPPPTASGLAIVPIRDISLVDFRHQSILDAPVIEAIGRELYALVDELARKKIILDFTKVQFLSSQMLGVIINLHKKSLAIKGQVVLCGVRPEIMKVFGIMKIDKVVRIVKTEGEAMEALGFHEGA